MVRKKWRAVRKRLRRWSRQEGSYQPYDVPSAMTRRKPTAKIRVHPKETVTLNGIAVTNRTANSIAVQKTLKGVVVTDCCLEEQGM